jgi:kynurenine formamidase
MIEIVDLSHEIENGMITYPGLPGPVITDYLSREDSVKHYAKGVSFQIGKIDLVANTGTYLDTPFHRYENRFDLAELPLESASNLEGILIDCTGHESAAIKPTALAGLTLENKAVLFHTGWDLHWRTEAYGGKNPHLTRDTAQALCDAGTALVGIDSLNIDDRNDTARPAHSILLNHGIPIVEHLCALRELEGKTFRFFAVPPKIRGLGSFPVRAFAIIEGAH